MRWQWYHHYKCSIVSFLDESGIAGTFLERYCSLQLRKMSTELLYADVFQGRDNETILFQWYSVSLFVSGLSGTTVITRIDRPRTVDDKKGIELCEWKPLHYMGQVFMCVSLLARIRYAKEVSSRLEPTYCRNAALLLSVGTNVAPTGALRTTNRVCRKNATMSLVITCGKCVISITLRNGWTLVHRISRPGVRLRQLLTSYLDEAADFEHSREYSDFTYMEKGQRINNPLFINVSRCIKTLNHLPKCLFIS